MNSKKLVAEYEFSKTIIRVGTLSIISFILAALGTIFSLSLLSNVGPKAMRFKSATKESVRMVTGRAQCCYAILGFGETEFFVFFGLF
jgi:hypothetical protein